MLAAVDRFINSITMYRLMLYGLVALSGAAFLLGALGVIAYGPVPLAGSFLILSAVCYLVNLACRTALRAAANLESSAITALILFLIMPPVSTLTDAALVAFAGATAMLSKYVLAIRKQHLVNPAAAGALLSALIMGDGAVWWIGSAPFFPLVAVLGFLVVRKIHRGALFSSFTAVAISTLVAVGASVVGWSAENLRDLVYEALVSWPTLFFASVMLVEPLTTPPGKKLQVIYGVLVGFLFAFPYRLGPLYATPELALVLGNIFSYAVGPQQKLFLTLARKTEVAKGIFHFLFTSPVTLRFSPGQYLEWTLPHVHPDARGVRRYFTVASSPTEREVAIGVKIIPKGSTFKRALLALSPGDTIVAGSLSGEFTLPRDQGQKLAFIAGGIGVTPFRSMIKSLVDRNERRDIVLFYACLSPDEFAYHALFEEARKTIGLTVVYIVTDAKNVSSDWKGRVGFIDAAMLRAELPDFAQRTFYLSGPSRMVDAYKKLLRTVGVSTGSIRTDYFPGY